MTQQGSARASWGALEAPWRAAVRGPARAVNSRYQESAHLPGTAAQALEAAWDLLTAATR